MKRLLLPVTLVILAACSANVNTGRMTMEEHLNYATSLYNDEDYLEAMKEFQAIIVQYPGSAANDDAQYYLGMTYNKRRQFLLAVYEFSKLIRDIPASPFVSESQYMLAESYYELSPHSSLDQEYTRKAIEEFQAFVDFFPTNSKVEEAEQKIRELNTKLAKKDFESAEIYDKMEYYTAALKYYNMVAETYHDSEYAPLALYRRANILIDRERIPEALNDIEVFLQRYSDNKLAPDMQKLKDSLVN